MLVMMTDSFKHHQLKTFTAHIKTHHTNTRSYKYLSTYGAKGTWLGEMRAQFPTSSTPVTWSATTSTPSCRTSIRCHFIKTRKTFVKAVELSQDRGIYPPFKFQKHVNQTLTSQCWPLWKYISQLKAKGLSDPRPPGATHNVQSFLTLFSYLSDSESDSSISKFWWISSKRSCTFYVLWTMAASWVVSVFVCV